MSPEDDPVSYSWGVSGRLRTWALKGQCDETMGSGFDWHSNTTGILSTQKKYSVAKEDKKVRDRSCAVWKSTKCYKNKHRCTLKMKRNEIIKFYI